MERNNLSERRFEFQTRAIEVAEQEPELWAEGYAARFDSPTVLFEMLGTEFKETIERGAFDECKMEDVIFNYNHGGKVIARTRNKTLQLTVDENGLFIRARLDGTEEGRKLHDEISKGYIDRMSFRFIVPPEGETFDNTTHMWTVKRFKRLYDVSAVDLPAYEDTSIEARKADAEAVARLYQQTVDTELTRKKLILKLKLEV